MRNIIAIATVSLAGLSFAPAAFAQRHSDSEAVDHSRPDHVSMQRERVEWSRPSIDVQRPAPAERPTVDRPDVPNRPTDTARPERMSPTTADAIHRAQERSTGGGGENDGPTRNHDARVTSSNTGTPSATPPVQRMSPTVAAAIQRIAEHGTSGGEDGAGRPHDGASPRSDNRTPPANAPRVERMTPTVAAAIQRIAEHGTSGGEDSSHSHGPAVLHSDNRGN